MKRVLNTRIGRYLRRLRKRDLFKICVVGSMLLHGGIIGTYYISTHFNADDADSMGISDVEVDFEDIPPQSDPDLKDQPAPVEKQEWVEGTSKTANDLDEEKEPADELSGEGTDSDGYLYSYNGDSPPKAVIDFDLRQYYPQEARSAGITGKTVMLLIQVDERGVLQSARVIGGKVGYGFEDAALKVVHRIKFRPGYADGVPTKMTHKLPMTFRLED